MIRSEVGVTDLAALAPDLPYVSVSERVVSTVCSEPAFIDRAAFRFFVMTRSFGTSQVGIDTYQADPTTA